MELPPAIQLLDTEFTGDNPDDLLRQFADRGFKRDLRDQAESSVVQFNYSQERHAGEEGSLVITPGGALDPFSWEEKCGSFKCRIGVGYSFARSIALYADYTVVPDPLSGTLASMGRLTERDARVIFSALAVVRELRPLIQHDVVRFARPGLAFCDQCRQQYVQNFDTAQDLLWKEFRASLEATLVYSDANQYLILVTSSLYAPGIVRQITLDASTVDPQLKSVLDTTPQDAHLSPDVIHPLLASSLKAEAFSVYRGLALAAAHKSIYAAGSRLQMAGIQAFEGREIHETLAWERARCVELPWVSDLNVEELMILRDHAKTALPRFRARVFEQISDAATDGDDDVVRAAVTLRAEVAELEAELAAVRPRGRVLPVAGGAVGLGLIIGGLVAQAAPVVGAGAGLLAALNLFFHKHAESEAREDILKTKPAYVLVAAKDLIRHRH